MPDDTLTAHALTSEPVFVQAIAPERDNREVRCGRSGEPLWRCWRMWMGVCCGDK